MRELDEEWDIERVLEANAASVAFAGTILAATKHKGWLMLPVLVSGFSSSMRSKAGVRDLTAQGGIELHAR